MADIRLLSGSSSPTRLTGDGNYIAARGTRDGALLTMGWLTSLVMEGRVFGANAGTGTAPVTLRPTFATTEADLYIYVPPGTTIIPVYLSVAFEDTGTAQVLDVLALASSTGDSSITGTATTVYNLKIGASNSSNCTATNVVSGTQTDPYAGYFLEFWRPYGGFGEDAFNSSVAWVTPGIHGSSWSAMTGGVPPIIVGSSATGSCLAVYASAQAGTGFIQAIWAEVPSTGI